MFPTIRPAHSILYKAASQVKLRRIIGRVETVIGQAEVQDFHGSYNAANNQKVIPGSIVLSEQAVQTDVGGVVVLRLENGLFVTLDNKARAFFQYP